jgi:hypothetical protein
MENKFATRSLLPEEGLSQRLAQLELRLGEMLIDKSTLKVGMVCLVFPASSSTLDQIL